MEPVEPKRVPLFLLADLLPAQAHHQHQQQDAYPHDSAAAAAAYAADHLAPLPGIETFTSNGARLGLPLPPLPPFDDAPALHGAYLSFRLGFGSDNRNIPKWFDLIGSTDH